MPLPRPRTSTLVVALALALAACGSARPTSTLIATAPPGGATTTTSAAPTTTTTTAPASGTTAGTTAATVAPSVPDATTAAPAATTAAVPTPTGAPTPTSTPAGGPLDATRVGALFTSFGYAVTDAEAACLAREITPTAVVALEQGGDPALVGPVTSAFVMALARCEPLSFLAEQDGITIDDYGVTPAEARCVTKALDAASRNDPVVAQAYFEGTNSLPAAGQQLLIDALTPCVGAVKAREIVTT